MRLREIHKIMTDNYDPIRKAINTKPENDGFTYIENYTQLVESLNNISKTQLISVEMDEFQKKDLLIVYPGNRVKFTKDRFKEFSDVLYKIQIKILAIDELINNIFDGHEEQEDTLVISMPDKHLEFSDMEEISESLNKTFTILRNFAEFNTDKIKIVDFDKGSNWLTVILGSIAALKIFGEIVLFAQQTKLNGLNRKFLEKQYESLELSQESQSAFIQASEQIALNFYQEAARKVIENNELDSSPESITHLTIAMNNIRELNDMGVAFQAGINSSIETAKKFPPIEQQKELGLNKMLDSLMKLPQNDE